MEDTGATLIWIYCFGMATASFAWWWEEVELEKKLCSDLKNILNLSFNLVLWGQVLGDAKLLAPCLHGKYLQSSCCEFNRLGENGPQEFQLWVPGLWLESSAACSSWGVCTEISRAVFCRTLLGGLDSSKEMSIFSCFLVSLVVVAGHRS